MNSRQRVLTALAHREPDDIPLAKNRLDKSPACGYNLSARQARLAQFGRAAVS
jgi:hypothetical protein